MTLFLLLFAWCVLREAQINSKVHCSFPQTLLIWGLQRTLLFLPSGELEGCSSSLQTKPPRCFKNHKWALNDFNLPARAQSERGENNQHQFCQLSSLCLLSCSQLTQIQLLSKLNERPHNCLVNTFFFFFACWSLLLHPWDVLKDRTASLSPALRGNKHKVNNELSKNVFPNTFYENN